MPTISPAWTFRLTCSSAGKPVVVVGEERRELERRPRRAARSARTARSRICGVADHHPRHVVGRELGDLAAADLAAAAQHRDARRQKARTSRNLCVIMMTVMSLRCAMPREQAEHLVGLAGREHRGRLVEDQQALVEIEQLEDFELLLLAGGERGDRHVERHAERHAVEELVERALLLLPVDHGRRIGAADHQILRAGQRRHQREVLVDHADAVGARIARIADRHLVAVEQHLAPVGE